VESEGAIPNDVSQAEDFVTEVRPVEARLLLPDAVEVAVERMIRHCQRFPALRAEPWFAAEFGEREPVFLLAGASGNGKTKIAHRLALRLGKRLFVANLEALISSYIGETNKNLNAMFRHVEAAAGVLLLDEGDAILTARSRTAGGGDGAIAHRQGISFLLRRLETLKVILLITTNMEESIDKAFHRRIHGRVHFSNPQDYTVHWQQALGMVGFDDFANLDSKELARVSERGGMSAADVKSVALQARLDADGAVTVQILEQALRTFLEERHSIERVRLARGG
jgi:SpoVK/Ycf46/Vps4 family AAA+-type ATPase